LLTELYNDRTPEGLSRVQNVEELINSLHEFVSTRLEEGREDVKLGDFLAEISLLTDQDTDKDEHTSRVTMMTIHSAKGLEFKNVFAVGLEEDLFPSERSNNNPKEIEEERRLFYVAITRAEENVFLTYAKSRFRNGQSLMCSPSRFIRDIDPVYLHTSGDAAFATSLREQRGTKQSKQSNENQDSGLLRSARNDETQAFSSPSAPPVRQNAGNLSVGNLIRHERFGIGEVIGLTGDNENARATVEFESVGRKQLLLKFAKFEIVG
jgi:DNA helicase-2/ATP-dependent DNA helicase PcrA